MSERGPMTVAAFMDRALYDSELGYYARAPRRSGRAGDFFTSVDVGPLFGELLERQIAEMAAILATFTADRAELADNSESPIPNPESRVPNPESQIPNPESRFDLVEAGAGDGRLTADILRAARERDPAFYDRVRAHLVDTSAAARAVHRATLGDVADRLASSSDRLPSSFEGVLVANELLDALPVHQVVMRDEGLREVYVEIAGTPARPVLREGPLSTPALANYLDRLGLTLDPGWRVEINLRAVDWVRDAARRLRRGFIILIDYGHEARELYSPTHAGGTLTTFARHTASGPESGGPGSDIPAWLQEPGDRDITAHVDFTTIRAAAEAEGLVTLGFLDQTYFVLGLADLASFAVDDLRKRLALKSLMMPGGLGSTHKVLLLGKDVGRPSLRGCSYRVRVT